MKYLLSLCFSGFSVFAYTQAPLEWARCYGLAGMDQFRAMEATPDSGFVLAGGGAQFGSGQLYVVKTDRFGIIRWEKHYGGTEYDYASHITAAHNNGYIVVGSSRSWDGDVGTNHGDEDLWIVRLDADGNKLWSKVYGGSDADFGLQVMKTYDGNYIVSGGLRSADVTGHKGLTDFWILKINDSGDILWQKIMGGTGDDYGAMKVKETPEHDLLFIGHSTSADGDVAENKGLSDIWLFKLDETGNLVWEKTYGGSTNDTGYDFLVLEDGGIMVLGQTNSVDGDVPGPVHGWEDFWLLRLNADGDILWSKLYGGNGPEQVGSFLRKPMEDGYLIAGSSGSADLFGSYGYYDFVAIQTDTAGTVEWIKNWGGSDYDDLMGGTVTWDGQYAFAGGTLSGRQISPDFDVADNHGESDGWLIKLGYNPLNVSEADYEANVSVYPNPAVDGCYIQLSEGWTEGQLSMVDITGKVILQKQINSGLSYIYLGEFPAGVYSWRISDPSGKTATGKLILR